MLRDPISSTATLMPLSPSASSPPPRSAASPTGSMDSAASSPTLLPIAASHAIKLLESDRSSANSPAIAPLVTSTHATVSPIAMSLETVSMKPSAAAAPVLASSNATHQKGQTGMNGGRWTEHEHQSFLAGLRLYGREWKKVAAKIKTRTSAQIRSHAQKYFAKLTRDDEIRKHSGLSMVMPVPVGYFSDGGSSVAQNSGDDDADVADVSRPMARVCSAKGTAAILIAPMGSAVSGLYKHTAGTTKKRARAAVTGCEGQLGVGSTASSYPYKLQKRTSDAARVECLPSQEELLAKASPNLRHRLSSLIEAELCALQVLSCYAMLQQQDQMSAPRQKARRQGKPRKLAKATNAATGSAKASTLGLSMLSTEQIPSTSSIY